MVPLGHGAAIFIAGLLRAGCHSGGFLGGSWVLWWLRPLCGVWVPLTRLFRVVSGLRGSAVEFRLCGLGHIWFAGVFH